MSKHDDKYKKKTTVADVAMLIFSFALMAYGMYCLYYWSQNPHLTQMQVCRWAIGLD